jgi:PleD family two-component response regulator
VVVLDFAMPTPNGIELAQQARGSGFNQRTLIIMISDDQRPSAVSEGFDAGAIFSSISRSIPRACSG